MGAWETETGVVKLPDGRVVRGTGARRRRPGVATDAAVAWARAHYHPRAVETRAQKRWLRDAARSVHSG